MTVGGTFTEKGVVDAISPKVMTLANYVIMLAIGFGMFYYSFTQVLPNDIFTSALFFDSLPLQPTLSHPAAAFAEGGIWESQPDTTAEALTFAMCLFLSQVFFAYKASTIGRWDNQSPNLIALVKNQIVPTKQKRGEFNYSKLGYMLAYWGLAIFDTVTDAYYRSFFATESLLIALIVSFLFYNLFSEWALITGAKTMINYGLQIINLIRRHAFSPPQQQRGGQQGNNSQGKPQQPKQQHGKGKGAHQGIVEQLPGNKNRGKQPPQPVRTTEGNKGKLPGTPKLRHDLQDFLEERR